MIFDRHINGPDNPGAIRYQNAAGEWKSIPVPEIGWVFQSEQPVAKGLQSDDPQTGSTPGNVHTVYIAKLNGDVLSFELPETDIEELYQDLQQANPNIITGALRGKRIGMQMLQNCRDLGGLQNKEGKFVVPHKLLRSDALHPADKHDRQILEKEYDLKTVVDLRTDWERLIEPDPIMLGVKHVHLPVFHESEIGITESNGRKEDVLKALENPLETMPPLYRKMVLDETGIQAWKKFFALLLEDRKGSLLFHCTQGKDRTGVAAMLLLGALDVDEDVIMADYELSTLYLHAQMNDILRQLETDTGRPASDFANLHYLYEADPVFLQAAVSAIHEKYGTIKGYLKEAVGLSDAQLETLAQEYLCTAPVPAEQA